MMKHDAAAKDYFWVFGYGSLMWRPGFPYENAVHARMDGVHRAPCIYSWVHRGTKDHPGIVLGLDRGGSCRGMAFMVSNAHRLSTLNYLRERELVTNVYRETTRVAKLATGESVSCVTFVVRRNHEQYAGKLPIDDLVDRISTAEGGSGRNRDYFTSTAEQLANMGIRDGKMEMIASRLEAK